MKKYIALLLALSMLLALAACGSKSATTSAGTSAAATGSGVEDGVLTVAMECAYTPYNWTQTDDSNGAVPIKNSTAGEYANGYDVMMAKKLCEANGWKLEVERLDWDSLIPAVQTGEIDAVIAGQSMTAERAKEVDFAGPYLYATIVCLTKSNSKFASATGISQLSGGTCTSQLGTVWYDTCLPQIPNAAIQTAADTAPAMIMALQTGTVDFICTDMPTAMGAVSTNPDMVILDFSGTDGDFQFASETERAENVNIGISVKKGNTELLDAMNKVLSGMKSEDFTAMMDKAISVAPAI